MHFLISVLRTQWPFLLFFSITTVLIGFVYQQFQLAMWIGFALAAFSSIGNDSIQTLGTFLTSNEKVRWWILWIFIGGIFALTISYGWVTGQGDISFGRLEKIEPVESFSFIHVFAPLVLLLLTQFKIPVSTTFLILSVFATSKTIESMLAKTFLGYVLSFVVAVAIWGIFAKFFREVFMRPLSRRAEKNWRICQWFATAFLWTSWLMQDTANIAVFLPRQLYVDQLLGVLFIGVAFIGIILYLRGGRIQQIVREKKDVTEVRAATLIDLSLAGILIFFKEINSVPMSTTWVFLGLLAGREVILELTVNNGEQYKETLKLVFKDIILAGVGLLVSLGLWLLTRV